MMMRCKKIGLFACDIYNTYLYGDGDHNKKLKKFIDNLDKLIRCDGLDILYFSFITTADRDLIEYVLDDIKYQLSDNIKLVEQFFYNGYVFDDKVYNYEYGSKGEAISFMHNKYHFDKIYFADDSLYHHSLVKENVMHFLVGNSNDNYYCSNNKGLDGLNEIIEMSYIDK